MRSILHTGYRLVCNQPGGLRWRRKGTLGINSADWPTQGGDDIVSFIDLLNRCRTKALFLRTTYIFNVGNVDLNEVERTGYPVSVRLSLWQLSDKSGRNLDRYRTSSAAHLLPRASLACFAPGIYYAC